MFPPFLVQFQPGSDVVKFKQIKYLCSCAIDIQRFKPTSGQGTQCYRCQRFGHASKNCNRAPRCVKCSESHATKDCPVTTKTDTPRCCNCNEEHVASYRQCPERLKFLQRSAVNQEKLQKTTSVSRPTSSAILTDTRNWPALRPTYPVPHFNSNMGNTKHESGQHASKANHKDLQDATTADMLQILSVIKTIKGEFSACDSMIDKVILVLTHLGQYV